jgi:2-dehydropantoate 2-reductase
MLDPQCVVVLLINGMGVFEELAEQWPGLEIYCGVTTEGAYRIAPQHIRHSGRGQTRLGQRLRTAPPLWFEQWQRAIQPCLWDGDIDAALWLKMAVNCAINPLTAVHHCRNGELAANATLAKQVKLVCAEVATISRAAGYAETAKNLEAIVSGVIADTAENHSSMLQDVQRGQHTEIDYITGYLLRVAERHNIAAPNNRALFERIKNCAN